MAQRLKMVLLGSAFTFWLLGTGPAWAVPKHDIEMGWSKGALYGKQSYGDDKYGDDAYPPKQDKPGKKSKSSSFEKYVNKDYEKWPDKDDWGDYTKEYKDHNEKKWGYGGCGKHGWKDPGCDPPVATPEPATVLLLGSTLAAAGWYARRRRP